MQRLPEGLSSLRQSWFFSVHQQMQCSLPPTTAAPLQKSNMTAPKNNFCYATDLAPMSEPDVYGAGIIGIVSYSSQQLNRSNQGATLLLNPPPRPRCCAAAIYGNLAFTCCEMDEQTGSASETKHLLLRPQGSKSLNGLTAPMYKIGRCF